MNDNKTQNNMNQNEKQVDSKDVEKYSRMIVGMSNMLKYGLISDLFFRYQGSTHMIGSQSAGKTSLLNDILNSEAENGFENRELLKTDEKAGTTMSTGILVGYNIEEKYAYKILYRNEITKGGNIALGENKGQKDDEILKSMKKEIEEINNPRDNKRIIDFEDSSQNKKQIVNFSKEKMRIFLNDKQSEKSPIYIIDNPGFRNPKSKDMNFGSTMTNLSFKETELIIDKLYEDMGDVNMKKADELEKSYKEFNIVSNANLYRIIYTDMMFGNSTMCIVIPWNSIQKSKTGVDATIQTTEGYKSIKLFVEKFITVKNLKFKLIITKCDLYFTESDNGDDDFYDSLSKNIKDLNKGIKEALNPNNNIFYLDGDEMNVYIHGSSFVKIGNKQTAISDLNVHYLGNNLKFARYLSNESKDDKAYIENEKKEDTNPKSKKSSRTAQKRKTQKKTKSEPINQNNDDDDDDDINREPMKLNEIFKRMINKLIYTDIITGVQVKDLETKKINNDQKKIDFFDKMTIKNLRNAFFKSSMNNYYSSIDKIENLYDSLLKGSIHNTKYVCKFGTNSLTYELLVKKKPSKLYEKIQTDQTDKTDETDQTDQTDQIIQFKQFTSKILQNMTGIIFKTMEFIYSEHHNRMTRDSQFYVEFKRFLLTQLAGGTNIFENNNSDLTKKYFNVITNVFGEDDYKKNIYDKFMKVFWNNFQDTIFHSGATLFSNNVQVASDETLKEGTLNFFDDYMKTREIKLDKINLDKINLGNETEYLIRNVESIILGFQPQHIYQSHSIYYNQFINKLSFSKPEIYIYIRTLWGFLKSNSVNKFINTLKTFLGDIDGTYLASVIQGDESLKSDFESNILKTNITKDNVTDSRKIIASLLDKNTSKDYTDKILRTMNNTKDMYIYSKEDDVNFRNDSTKFVNDELKFLNSKKPFNVSFFNMFTQGENAYRHALNTYLSSKLVMTSIIIIIEIDAFYKYIKYVSTNTSILENTISKLFDYESFEDYEGGIITYLENKNIIMNKRTLKSIISFDS